MTYFNKNILAHHTTFQLFSKCRTLIVMEQVLRKSCTLSFPITPDSHSTMMNMISSHNNINCSMHFNSGNFCSAQFHHIVDMVNMIILNNTEYTTHTPDNTSLLTVVDIVSADNMTSYFFLKPAMILSTAYRVSFHLSLTLNIFISKIMIIFRIIIFSKRNSCTFAVRNFAVLNDPSFTPVRPDHAILISCRRCPGSCCFCNYETTDCDISNTCF